MLRIFRKNNIHIERQLKTCSMYGCNKIGRVDRFVHVFYVQLLTICLGFYSLANALNFIGVPYLRPIAWITTAVVLALMIGRALYIPRQFIEELRSPAGIAAYQTGVMATYFFSAMLAGVDQAAGHAIWSVAFACNLVLIALFVEQYVVKNFSIKELSPVWYLIFVGIGASAITGWQMGFHRVAFFVSIYATIAYIIITPLIIFRLMRYEALSQNMQPTKAIMCAAPSLVLVMLLTVSPGLNFFKALPFLILSQVFLFWIYRNIIAQRNMPFCVTFGSLTFPLGISVLALLMVRSHYFVAGSLVHQALGMIAFVELVIAACVICYVIWHFVCHLLALGVTIVKTCDD